MSNLLPHKVQNEYFPLYLLMLRIHDLLAGDRLAGLAPADPVIEAALEALNPASPQREDERARLWYYIDGYLLSTPAERPVLEPDALAKEPQITQFKKFHAYIDARRPFWRAHISDTAWMQVRQIFVANGVRLLDPFDECFVESPVLRELVYLTLRTHFTQKERSRRQAHLRLRN